MILNFIIKLLSLPIILKVINLFDHDDFKLFPWIIIFQTFFLQFDENIRERITQIIEDILT